VQRFTAHMPLLTETSAIGLGRRCWSSPQQCYLFPYHNWQKHKQNLQHSRVACDNQKILPCDNDLYRAPQLLGFHQ